MRGRELILPQRKRKIPPQFSWVDHRLVRDGHIQGRSAPALALYLFLVTVADADGLSWYSDEALCRQLSCEPEQLHRDRDELRQAGLIAYRRPLYQVLDLAQAMPPTPHAHGGGGAVALGEILSSILGGAR
jgi:hypothetical protein